MPEGDKENRALVLREVFALVKREKVEGFIMDPVTQMKFHSSVHVTWIKTSFGDSSQRKLPKSDFRGKKPVGMNIWTNHLDQPTAPVTDSEGSHGVAVTWMTRKFVVILLHSRLRVVNP
ncbi:hypothetical protein ACOSQ3_021661 [Xanthoceras sorbifolium]